MKRLLITGTRDGWNPDHLEHVLREWFWTLSGADDWDTMATLEPVVLVHGDAPGVDKQAARIWEKRGLPTEPHPAKWKELGKGAGPARNSEMVNLGADQCIAFPGPSSVGTYDCLFKARRANIPTEIYEL